MNELQTINNSSLAVQEITLENRLEIIEEGMRRKYLSRLTEMQIAPLTDMQPLESDLIDNYRLYRITEMVYHKGEPATNKFTTVFNTLSTYNASVFIIIDSDGINTDFYLGVRNNEKDESKKRSTVTLGDTLKNTLIGHFPGIKIDTESRHKIAELSNKIQRQHNVASVSVVGTDKTLDDKGDEHFVQGLEKLALAMSGKQYIGIIVADNQSPQSVQILRKTYQDIYTKLSPYRSVQVSDSDTTTTNKSKSFFEMSGKQKAAMLGGAVASLTGVIGGAIIGAPMGGVGATGGAMVGGQIMGQFSGFLNSLAPNEQSSTTTSTTTTTTSENKAVIDLLNLIDDSLKRLNEFDSYGMWNVAGYFISDDMSASEIAASNYRSLMNGENSGCEVSAINSWRSNDPYLSGNFVDLTTYLSRFIHPQFYYGNSGDIGVLTDATTSISGKELGLHLGLPRATVPGLPVVEHAEFGKEVYKYKLFGKNENTNPEDRMTLGRVFDLGQITNKVVELNNKSLNMHTFITGSTGSGKSNTVYQMLSELHQDKIPFLVIEPAKGEYKDVFGHMDDVNVYSTNPEIAELININPFKFPSSIHVLEHVDGLVEIFSVCWPMYDAMPAFFKDAILRSYESVGWDLGSSKFEGDSLEYPDFEILAEQLDELISNSDYASDIKSNYRGALITRVRSLTVGLNKYIFTNDQTPYEKLFDENCILDISRVKSSETKALIMGLMVYILNEHRCDCKTENNRGCTHITVLEEAHNLLKNTSGGGQSELIGKSVEMLTNTIAEIRTYGEGFVIVDQSPSSVDISAIKNTNTKIILRTPEANDREAVGRSMGLTEEQVNEIAKLPSGVAVVYQNDWVKPVLTMIDRANVKEKKYVYRSDKEIPTLKQSRSALIKMVMQPWFGGEPIETEKLKQAVKVLSIPRKDCKRLYSIIEDYELFGGQLVWTTEQLPELGGIVKMVLGITDKDIAKQSSPDELTELVKSKLNNLKEKNINDICYVITTVKEVGSDDG
ncbi:DUF87 domain-containing protein [uncultured Ruminococcus sp.]|uniref:helicase HerA domain-containing protein n=1 Tax=uncultured Ruminococcus sp. TaxID=165186 RepID=UPI0025FDC219|nr:DUF87 domain-containing protein [uncultured Ruminococcus sp.]